MNGKKVLLIDDDIDSLRLNRSIFNSAGAQVFTAQDGLDGMSKLFIHKPDLIILDVMMPGKSGFDVCQKIRDVSDTPVIMLTALNQEMDILKGLEVGADDFLSKPFSVDILLARATAVLRRSEQNNGKNKTNIIYEDDHLIIDVEKHQTTLNEKRVKLTPTEFRLLVYLAENAGVVLPFERILNNVWGNEYQGSDDYVHVYVSHLRSKMEPDPKNPRYITSVHGVGYLFEKQTPVEKKTDRYRALTNNKAIWS